MKKLVLLNLVLFWSLVLVACDTNSGWTSENNLPIDSVNQECIKVIQNYLDGADKEGKWEWVKEWDNIVVDYIWRLEDGTVFDTSIQSVAEACGKYNEYRDYTEWLSFEAWANQMIEWFDEGVIWMKVWQTKTVQFWPEKWYGLYDESLVITIWTDEVWDVSEFSEWDTVYLWMWYPAKIVKISDDWVTFDMNSELAGKSLIFDITLKSID